jgi:hypothetical protein
MPAQTVKKADIFVASKNPFNQRTSGTPQPGFFECLALHSF